MKCDTIDDLDEADIISDTDNDLSDIDRANQKDPQVRRRIDDLLERKRLRELLDETDDWDV